MHDPTTGARRTLFGPWHNLARRLAPALFVAVLALAAHAPAFAQRGTTVSFLPDATATLGIEDAASPANAGKYQVYVPSFMAFSRLPDDFNGAVWLRVVVDSSFKKPTGALCLNLGAALPGVTRLFVPSPDGGFTALESPPPVGLFTLPENALLPGTLYARVDGTPGLWFRPVLGAAPETGSPLPPHLILCGMFAFAMLLLLIRYIRTSEEWRLWAAVTAGLGIVTALVPPVPAAGSAFTPLMAATMLLPGLMLAFFAHTGRHLFDAPRSMPGYDALLVLQYFIGALVALCPLVPGFLWASRYLPLAGIALVPLLVVAMAALARSRKGSLTFFCATLLPIAGVAVAAWELTSPTAPLAGASGGLWGFAVGMVILGFIRPVRVIEETRAEDDVFASLDRSTPDFSGVAAGAALHLHETRDAPEPPVAEQLAVAATPFLPSAPEPETRIPDVPESETPEPESPKPVETPAFAPSPAAEHAPRTDAPAPEDIPETAHEEDLLGEPVAQTLALEEYIPEDPVAEYPIAEDATPEEQLFGKQERAIDDFSELDVAPPPAPVKIFDLPLLVKEVYDGAALLAEQKNIGMSWFIAPQTGRLFEGRADALSDALGLLLRDMVEAVDRGNVRLNIRRLPDSKDAGHLVFSIVEWDAKNTAHARNMAGLAEAWALAESTGGIFSVEHSPLSGTTVIFSSIFTLMDKPKSAEETSPEVAPLAESDQEPEGASADVPVFAEHSEYPDAPVPEEAESPGASLPQGIDADELTDEETTERDPARIIVADATASGRAWMLAAFKDSPYVAIECASASAAVILYARHPAALVVMNADMPETDIASAIRDIHAWDNAQGLPPVPVAALVDHDAQADRMMASGCARTVLKPVEPEELLALARELAPQYDAPSSPASAAGEIPTPDTDVPAEDVPTPETVLHAALEEIPSMDAKDDATDDSREPVSVPDDAPGGIFTDTLPPDTGSVQSDSAPSEAKTSLASRPVGMGLLDMIVAEGEEEDGPETPPAAHDEAELPRETATAVMPPAPAAPIAAPSMAVAPTVGEEPRTGIQDDAEARFAPVAQKVKETAMPPSPQGDMPTTPGTPAPAPAPAMAPSPESVAVATKPVPDVEPGMSVATAPAESAPATTPAPDPVAAATKQVPDAEQDAPGVSVPLPGEEDSVFRDMLPLTPGLVHELSDAMADAARGREEKSPLLVQQAAERVAGKASAFGLTRLERIARCVERAAAADDIEPMECVLADLEAWIERYKKALITLHRAQW